MSYKKGGPFGALESRASMTFRCECREYHFFYIFGYWPLPLWKDKEKNKREKRL